MLIREKNESRLVAGFFQSCIVFRDSRIQLTPHLQLRERNWRNFFTKRFFCVAPWLCLILIVLAFEYFDSNEIFIPFIMDLFGDNQEREINGLLMDGRSINMVPAYKFNLT